MHTDGRFTPFEVIAQVIALVAVLWTWWRVDRKHPAEKAPGTFYAPQNVTGPSSYRP